MNAFIALLGTLVCIAILFAAWIGLTERGRSTDDWFRTRWGGSDAKELHEPMARFVATTARSTNCQSERFCK